MRFEDLTGCKFGKLSVIERVNGKQNRQTYWKCRCECGKETIVTAIHLKQGHTQSCGCLQREAARKTRYIHGKTKTKLYHVWRGMKDRTCNPNPKYKDYSGRGIKICPEWKDNFYEFYTWAIANGYETGLTIDRIDVNGNYEPKNCRWVSMKVQNNNRRNNHYITYKGETHTMKEWSEILKINYTTLSMRLNKYVWSVERSFGVSQL